MALCEKQDPSCCSIQQGKKSKKEDDINNVKAWPDAHLDDFPKVAFSTVLLWTFHMFNTMALIPI